MQALKLLIPYEIKILLLGIYHDKRIGEVCKYWYMIIIYVIAMFT